mgnify:FL=1
MMRPSGFIFLMTLVLFGAVKSTLAQQPKLYVYGTVREYLSGDSIPFPSIQYQEVQGGSAPMPVVTNARGRFELELTEEKIFWIIFSAQGYVSKLVEIDMHGPTLQQWEKDDGFGWRIEMTLFHDIPGVDFSILKEPLAKIRFNPLTEQFEWDLAYTESIRKRIQSIMDEYDAREKQDK